MSRIPAVLEREIQELGRFKIRHTAVVGQMILTAQVRGVPIVMHLDADQYPAVSPRLELSPQWSWGRGGPQIKGLYSLDHWNRTLGIGTLLRELEKQFNADPPRQRKTPRGDGLLVRLWRSIIAWFRNLDRRLIGRGKTAVADETPLSEVIRARYQEIIVEKAARIERYRQAVAQLMTQWQLKTAKLEELGDTVERLEQSQESTLLAAQRIVRKLEAAGQTATEVKEDDAYRRCLASFEEGSAELEQARERLAELEADGEDLHEKIREHEAQLEMLMAELQQIRDESSDVAADWTTVELEQEIVDLRAGISRSDADEELRDLLQELRKAKASVRITRKAADLDAEAQDAEYLGVARKVAAARQFEASVGLGETLDAGRRDRE